QTLIVRGFSDKMPGYTLEDGNPAGNVPTGGDVAAAPFAATIPGVFGPVVIVTTQDIVKGATVTALVTSIDPPLDNAVPALPDPITFPQTAEPPGLPKP